MLRKKESQKPGVRKLFRDRGAALMQNASLEHCSRRTEFNEDQFVRYYPYLPYLFDFSIEVLAGIQLQPNAPKYVDSNNRTIVKQCFEMLVSKQNRLADRPVGALLSIDRFYELVEGNISWEKQKNVLDIRQRFDDHPDYPGTASRVAKAICVMELAKPGLPRTTKISPHCSSNVQANCRRSLRSQRSSTAWKRRGLSAIPKTAGSSMTSMNCAARPRPWDGLGMPWGSLARGLRGWRNNLIQP